MLKLIHNTLEVSIMKENEQNTKLKGYKKGMFDAVIVQRTALTRLFCYMHSLVSVK